MSGPEWGHVSSIGKHFVRALMTLNPIDRLDVNAALNHPWMNQIESNSQSDSRSNSMNKNSPFSNPNNIMNNVLSPFVDPLTNSTSTTVESDTKKEYTYANDSVTQEKETCKNNINNQNGIDSTCQNVELQNNNNSSQTIPMTQPSDQHSTSSVFTPVFWSNRKSISATVCENLPFIMRPRSSITVPEDNTSRCTETNGSLMLGQLSNDIDISKEDEIKDFSDDEKGNERHSVGNMSSKYISNISSKQSNNKRPHNTPIADVKSDSSSNKKKSKPSSVNVVKEDGRKRSQKSNTKMSGISTNYILRHPMKTLPDIFNNFDSLKKKLDVVEVREAKVNIP